MSGIIIRGFAGMRPIADPKLLNGNEAQLASNTKLISGAIDSYKTNSALTPKRLATTINTIFRARRNADESLNWFEFNEDVDAIRSPVYQDDHGRTYWTGQEFPKYAPELVAFAAGSGAYPRGYYQLGVPAPEAENQRPAVTGTAVAEPDEQTREYVVTYTNTDASIESGMSDVVSTTVLKAPLDQGYYEIDSIAIETSTTTLVTFKTVVDITTDHHVVLYGFTNSAWNTAFPVSQLVNEKTVRITTPTGMPATTGTARYAKRRTLAQVNLSGLPNVGYNDERVTKMRLYRKVSGTYKRLAIIDVANSDYQDSLTDAQCASLPSMSATVQYRPNTPTMSPIATIPYNDTSFKDNPSASKVSRIYAVSFVSSGGYESVLSASSGIVALIDGTTSILVQHSETPPEGAVKKRIYRQDVTISGTGYLSTSQSNYKLVVELPATQDAYTDTFSAATLASRAAPTVIDGLEPPSTTPSLSGNLTPIVLAETRVYVYTYVTEYGEEGPPSLPSVATSIDPTEPVTVSNMAVAPTGAYNITKKYIYRTSTSSTATDYQFVAEVPVATTSFVDRLKQVELGEPIPSIDWYPPPLDAKGLRMMANGIAVMYSGKDLLFSPPFMPHAYPTAYRLTLEDDVVGIGVFGQSVVAVTNSFPYIANGVDPESMTLTKTSIQQACVSKRSIAETGDSIIYASPDGLVMIGAGGFQVVTKSIFTPQQWQAMNPSSIRAYMYENRYMAFFTKTDGTSGLMQFDFTGQSAVYVQLDTFTTAAAYVPELDSLVMVDGSNLSKFDKGSLKTYTWLSKVFEAPEPTNYAFGQVIATSYGSGIEFKLFADDVLVTTQTVTSANGFRLPSGFKARNWAIQLSGNTPIQSVAVVKTAQELKQI